MYMRSAGCITQYNIPYFTGQNAVTVYFCHRLFTLLVITNAPYVCLTGLLKLPTKYVHHKVIRHMCNSLVQLTIINSPFYQHTYYVLHYVVKYKHFEKRWALLR